MNKPSGHWCCLCLPTPNPMPKTVSSASSTTVSPFSSSSYLSLPLSLSSSSLFDPLSFRSNEGRAKTNGDPKALPFRFQDVCGWLMEVMEEERWKEMMETNGHLVPKELHSKGLSLDTDSPLSSSSSSAPSLPSESPSHPSSSVPCETESEYTEYTETETETETVEDLSEDEVSAPVPKEKITRSKSSKMQKSKIKGSRGPVNRTSTAPGTLGSIRARSEDLSRSRPLGPVPLERSQGPLVLFVLTQRALGHGLDDLEEVVRSYSFLGNLLPLEDSLEILSFLSLHHLHMDLSLFPALSVRSSSLFYFAFFFSTCFKRSQRRADKGRPPME